MKQAIRVQRSRNKKPGIPESAFYAGRPSKWGNPAKIGEWYKLPRQSKILGIGSVFIADNLTAVAAFYEYCIAFYEQDQEEFMNWLLPLEGKNLCCWCSADMPCHADILLYLVNNILPTLGDEEVHWPALSEIMPLHSTI